MIYVCTESNGNIKKKTKTVHLYIYKCVVASVCTRPCNWNTWPLDWPQLNFYLFPSFYCSFSLPFRFHTIFFFLHFKLYTYFLCYVNNRTSTQQTAECQSTKIIFLKCVYCSNECEKQSLFYLCFIYIPSHKIQNNQIEIV